MDKESNIKKYKLTMKTRHSLVSNSSSSSFIVTFTKKPETIEDVMLALFKEDSLSFRKAMYISEYRTVTTFTNLQIAEVVLNDIHSHKNRGRKIQNNGCFRAYFNYCDEGGGLECIMEHSGVFRNLEHEVENNH